MKRSQLLITALLFALLLIAGFATRLPVNYGAVPWFGWVGLALAVILLGVALVIYDTTQQRARVLAAAQAAASAPATVAEAQQPLVVDPDGPPYPHPVINAQTCIGCHACVEACPHDVLAIVNGISTPVALEQCMEDTSCQVECPTSPKSCVVVNTTKKIPERKVPKRDQSFMTNVPGVYLIGDVSGVPLIKNAINEGGAVIEHIVEDLKREGANGLADYDVAIIGIGPAGLSATAIAKQRGLKYIAIEQDQVVATIQNYPAGKYVFFKPDTVETAGGIALPGAGLAKEVMIQSWMDSILTHQLQINEWESCKSIKPADGLFLVATEQDQTKQQMEYKARRVILAIGNRGTPMRLRVPGEELRITVTPTQPAFSAFCQQCGVKRTGAGQFCQQCGAQYAASIPPPYQDDKVKYKLSDPNAYQGKHCVVVGAGNSAVEAAVDLAAYRSADGTKITGWRDNTVTLVIRSDFKGDLKLGNKMMVYEGIDEGRIKAYFRATIKEITETEVVLMDARERDPKTAKEKARFKNDYVFALIGGDKPTKFLESIGIKIG
jgi:thioredoxin reductase (NADPH)